MKAARMSETAGGGVPVHPRAAGVQQDRPVGPAAAPDGEQTVLQMAHFDRSRAPVVMEIGPVLALEDVAGGKVCALASRVEPRDYATPRGC